MAKILTFFIVLYLLFSFANSLNAQICVQNFIADVLNVSQNKDKKFYKEALTTSKSYFNDPIYLKDVRFLYIPVVFSTREGAKLSSAGKLSKEKLLCYLDGKSLTFDEAFAFKDTAVLGVIIQSPNPAFVREFIRDIDLYRVQLAKKIVEINPDIIFIIYNLPRCYWFLKNNELYVLSYKHENTEIGSFMIYRAELFIKEHLNEKDLCFLSYKRIIVISGR